MLRCAFIQVRDLLWEQNWVLRVFITDFVLSGLMKICFNIIKYCLAQHVAMHMFALFVECVE